MPFLQRTNIYGFLAVFAGWMGYGVLHLIKCDVFGFFKLANLTIF
jgi:hypothetical protein